MMINYTGGGAYCFSNSLHMCLQQAGLDARFTPGVLECLGGMAVGAAYYRGDGPTMFFPSSPATEPDRAVSQALAVLGWQCDEQRAGSEAEAATRLRSTPLPFQVGPVNMGWLRYNPNYANLDGADHYVTVLAVDDEQVTVHDPAGFANATLPIAEFMQAWSAEGVTYGPYARPLAYVTRANFRAVESLTWDDVLQRGLAVMREMAQCDFAGPMAYSGAAALQQLAADLRAGQGEAMQGHLTWFSLPLGARRSNDAAVFLEMCGQPAAADLARQKSRLYGATVYPTVHQQWEATAHLLDELAAIETAFVAALSA